MGTPLGLLNDSRHYRTLVFNGEMYPSIDEKWIALYAVRCRQWYACPALSHGGYRGNKK